MGHRRRDLGVSARTCGVCGEAGTLQVVEIQDTRRRAGIFTVKDREPYRIATCEACGTRFPIRSTD